MFICWRLCMISCITLVLSIEIGNSSKVITAGKEKTQELSNFADDKPSKAGAPHKVWMESIMYHHTLRWQAADVAEARYTVYYKVKNRLSYNTKVWSTSCDNTSHTYCDMSEDLDALLYYYVTVKVETERSEPKMFATITFIAEHQTNLLPPIYTASRKDNILFIQATTDRFKTTRSKFDIFDYQVKYWASDGKNSSDNFNMTTFNSNFGTEITIEVDKPWLTYCLTIRLKSMTNINHKAKTSSWSEVACLEANGRVSTLNTNIALICAGSVSTFLLFSVLFSIVYKQYKKISKDDGMLPKYLETVKQEMGEPGYYKCNKDVDCVRSLFEQADPMDVDSYIHLDESAYGKNTFVDLDWSSRNSKRVSTYSDVEPNESASLWCEDSIETKDSIHLAALERRQRLRSRSRGYYSFSSDDVIIDDMAKDDFAACVSFNSAVLFKAHSDERNSGAENNIQRRESWESGDYVIDVNAPTRKCATKRSHEKKVQIFTLSSHVPHDCNAYLPIASSPCQNLTYFTPVYDNIPDTMTTQARHLSHV